MKITREQLRRWGACYDDELIAALVPEVGLTPLEISELDIPENDRLWVLLHEEINPARELRLLACGWADSACRKAGWNDERSLNAISVGRRHAVGEASEAELVEAWTEAAWAALSLCAAALSARSSVRESVRESAWWSALWASAASAAARSEQLADVVRVLKRIDEAAQAGKELSGGKLK